VGYVGGNTPIKGFHLVRKVFTELGDIPATLVLVDNTLNLGFSSYGPDAIQGLHHVEVVPAYTTETIDAFFADIDVLLFPTQWKESFGLTVREAIARNVWVIATDAGGVVEDIEPGRNGTIIPFGDDGTALAAAVIDAVAMLNRMRPGDAIVFDSGGIRFWEQQAAELAGMLRGCVRAARRGAA
jgi:glycosyltransferase involved in cell wall biosynthesis